MVSEDAGHRSADGAFEWTQGEIEGKPLVIRHSAPDVTSHLYPPGDIDEPILLYRGRFSTQPDEPTERAYDGDVRLSWLPTPRIEARGERDSMPGDVEALLNDMSATDMWQLMPQIYLPDTMEIPPAPSGEATPRSGRAGTFSVGPMGVYPAEIGDGSALTRVTRLIPNGWDSHDGHRIAAPADRRRTWFGRATARGGGWVLIMDALERGSDFRDQLRRRGGC